MFSYCRQERDAQGCEAIELGMNEKRVKFSIVAVPIVFVIVMYFVMDLPLIMAAFGLILFPVIFAGVGFQFLGGIAEQTALRVTLDSKAGRILVASASGQSEIRMVEVAKARVRFQHQHQYQFRRHNQAEDGLPARVRQEGRRPRTRHGRVLQYLLLGRPGNDGRSRERCARAADGVSGSR